MHRNDASGTNKTTPDEPRRVPLGAVFIREHPTEADKTALAEKLYARMMGTLAEVDAEVRTDGGAPGTQSAVRDD